MKKILSLLSVLLLAVAGIYGQQPAPGILNYQGVARNSVGNVLVNKNITLRLTIRDGSAAGPTVYSETRPVTTNPFGLFNVQLGSPGATSVTGSIPAVPWGVGLKYIQVEIDPNGGSSFINIGTAQLASVPYSLYASTANDLVLPFIKTQADNGVLFSITNSGNNTGSRAIEGATNSIQANAYAIVGTVTNAAPGAFSTGVRGINNGTGGNGIGVWGSQAGTGYGVYATTSGGWALRAETNSGVGVYGQSSTGTGVQGVSNTGSAGMFNNTNAGNAAVTLTASSNGTGDVFNATTTGTGSRAGLFQNNNAANTQHVLAVNNAGGAGHSINSTTAGTGSAGLFNINNAASTATALQATTVGTGGAGSFTINNAAATADALTATTNGGASSWALRATSNGAQGAGIFTYNNTGGAANAVRIMNNGSGIGMFASTSGTGNAGRFDNTNATNPSVGLLVNTNGLGSAGAFNNTNAISSASTVQINTNGLGSALRIDINNPASPGLGVHVTSNSGGNAISGINSGTTAVTGRAGFFQLNNPASTADVVGVFNQGGSGNGIVSSTSGTGWAGVFSSSNGTPRALWTSGAVRLQNLNEGLNRVLTSIDALGNAQWQPIAAIGIVGGTGTLNRVAKWTPDGFNIGNSLTWDDGSRVRTGLGPTFTDNNTLTLINTSATGNDAVLSFQGSSGFGNTSGIYMEDATNSTHLTVNNYDAALGTKVMTWDGNNGNVGINTATPNPQAKLHVDGSGAEFPYAILATSRTGTTSFNTHGVWADGSWRGVYGTNLSTVSRFRSIGVQGVAGGSNYSVEAVGVWAEANGTGTAGVNNYGLYATASGAAGQNFAAWMNGTVRITDGTQGAGRIFTSDAGGNGSWQAPAAAGLVSGSGTLDYIPKWTPDGNTLGNSAVFEDGFGRQVHGGTAVSDAQKTHIAGGGVYAATYYQTALTGTGAGNGFAIGQNTIGGNEAILVNFENAPIRFATSSTERMRIQGSGQVGIGTNSPVARMELRNYNSTDNSFTSASGFSGATGIASYDITAETGFKTGIYSYADGASGSNLSVWGDAGTTSTVLNAGLFGRVSLVPAGAGPSAAIMALDAINGPNTWAAIITGRLQYQDGTQGAGRVLTSDANGNASWQPPVNVQFRVHGQNIAQSIPNITATDLTNWAVVDYNDGGGTYNGATGEYTVPATGLYMITAKPRWAGFAGAPAGTRRVVIIKVNGVQIENVSDDGTNNTFQQEQVTAILKLNAGDIVSIAVFQNSGAAQNSGSAVFADASFTVTQLR